MNREKTIGTIDELVALAANPHETNRYKLSNRIDWEFDDKVAGAAWNDEGRRLRDKIEGDAEVAGVESPWNVWHESPEKRAWLTLTSRGPNARWTNSKR